jgi:Co/Zn/Cd efflux system component
MLDNLKAVMRRRTENPYLENQSDTGGFILLTLLREGPMDLRQLEEKSFILISQVGFHGGKHERNHPFDIPTEIETLLKEGLVTVSEGCYELTDQGRSTAEKSAEMIEKGAQWVNANIMNPKAAARNTVVADLFLAVIKLGAALFSGSVGLLADGADAAVDTGSAGAVWLGMKANKEVLATVVIVCMMEITGVTVGYESVTKIVDIPRGMVQPLVRPYLVIIVEGVALIFAALLCLYQGFTGKRFGSLALISQSIDSRNHIYVAVAVITGAVFSLVGIYFVDALIGLYVSFKIVKDGLGLSREVILSFKGEPLDFSKYEVLLEKRWKRGHEDAVRTWVLYLLREGALTREELINTLERTLKNTYIPLVSEFGFAPGTGYDFEEQFEQLVSPLLAKGALRVEGDAFLLTEAGSSRLKSTLKNLRFHQLA